MLPAKSSGVMTKSRLIITLVGFVLLAASWRTQAEIDQISQPVGTVPAATNNSFSPSNARTADNSLIATDAFFPAARCASCHKDTHAGWSQSLHRNAGREPFYKESVDILLRSRGIELTRHCESCHAPVALLSGALTAGSKEPRSFDDEGVTCSVCHSITEARLDGTGSYTIRRPALLAREDGTPIPGDVANERILADIPGHRRAVMRPLLKQPEFCATCHKSSAPPELNNYKFTRGFSAYDEWQQSGASHETLTPFYRRVERADCRACHMPRVDSVSDLAAKGGMIASHRWLGANTAAPLFYNQVEQEALTEKFLKAGVLNVDIFAVKSGTSAEPCAPLAVGEDNRTALEPGQEAIAEVVIANRNAAHSFPPELRDLYEAWIEFEVIDAVGKTLYHSGFLQSDATLDDSAHVYRSVLLDESGHMITRHQVWAAKIKAYDNAIPPGRSDLVRFRFRLPGDVETVSPIILRARVNYRRFNQEYIDYVLGRVKARLTVPVVQMAEAQVRIVTQGPDHAGTRAYVEGQKKASGKALAPMRDGAMNTAARLTAPSLKSTARRWNDYGIGLLEQFQYGPAAEAFRHASELDPADLNLMVNAAIAEMKTEQYSIEREQLAKAAALLDCALRIDPTHARARFYKALVLRGQGKAQDAANELRALAILYPRDREVQRQLGQTLYVLGQIAEARVAFEALSDIDPTDAGAYQFLSPIYASAGRKLEADRARSLYLNWRDDPLADRIAAGFFGAQPQWADERIPAHVHSADSPSRPTVTGTLAAPEK
jgi:tetratricopeptide (TPR) repeat protein